MEEDLHRELPKARIARLDRDTVSGKRHYESILQNFREGRRRNATMTYLVSNLPDAYLQEIAAYFAALHPPYAAPPAA